MTQLPLRLLLDCHTGCSITLLTHLASYSADFIGNSWSQEWDSNPRPADYESVPRGFSLPIVLRQPIDLIDEFRPVNSHAWSRILAISGPVAAGRLSAYF